jgi:hypothetical protein
MRRWDQRLARLIRALMACTVLLFAAHGPVFAVEPVRDVSAWLAVRQAPMGAAPRMARAGAVRSRASVAVQRARQSAPLGSVPRMALGRSRTPIAARSVLDDRYLYLDLQTLRC